MSDFYRPRRSNKYIRRRGPGGYDGPVPPHTCPETGQEVTYYYCASECPKYGVHIDGDVPRCRHEFEKLRSEGYYAKGDEWLEYLEDLDPQTWQRLIEEKRNRERVLEEMENERQGDMNQSEETEKEKSATVPEKDECADEPEEEKPGDESNKDSKKEKEKQTDDEWDIWK
jgi:hypothetical protein